MPTYEYRCQNCQKESEIFHKISDPPILECPHCHQPALVRGPGGGIGVAFKGKGFYVNDYAPSEKSGGCCPCGKGKGDCKT